jgi:integrase
MSKEVWHSTSYVGVRYREHPTRKHNGKPDRYYVIRYKRGRNLVGEGAGWNSDGVTGQKAHILRAEIIQNIREGKKPQSLAEKRFLQEEKRRNEELKRLKEKKESITFQVAAEKFFEWAKSNKKDWKNDVNRYENHLRDEFSAMKLKDISSLRLEKLKSDLQKKGLAPKTINHCLTLVRSIYRRASMWSLYSGPVPTDQLAFPKNDNRRLRFLNEDEAKRILSELKNVSPIVHDQALLSLHTGLRFGEIANLCWSDIDLENDIIQVRDPKSGDSRHAYITPAIKDVFLNLRRLWRAEESRNGGRQKTVTLSS